jgi:RNA polymerase sigma factor (sigma-70 family)
MSQISPRIGDIIQDKYNDYLKYAEYYAGEDLAEDVLQEALAGYGGRDNVKNPEAYITRSIQNASKDGFEERGKYIPTEFLRDGDFQVDNHFSVQDLYHCNQCGHELNEENTYVITHWGVDKYENIQRKSIHYHKDCSLPCPQGYKNHGYFTKVVQVPWRVPKWSNPWSQVEACIDVSNLLTKLTPKERDCVAAHELYQGDREEVANRYHIQPKTIQKISERAVKKLSKIVVKIT